MVSAHAVTARWFARLRRNPKKSLLAVEISRDVTTPLGRPAKHKKMGCTYCGLKIRSERRNRGMKQGDNAALSRHARDAGSTCSAPHIRTKFDSCRPKVRKPQECGSASSETIAPQLASRGVSIAYQAQCRGPGTTLLEELSTGLAVQCRNNVS